MRLSLDWDGITFDEFVKRLKVIRNDFPNKMIVTEKSASGKGYHVTVYFACKTFKKQIELRKKYKDDKARIAIDSQQWKKGIPIGILFTQKGGRYARRY